MSRTLEQILGYVPLTGLIRGITTGIPNVMPPQFWNLKQQVVGNVAMYMRVKGNRTLPPAVRYGSPSRQLNTRPIDQVPVKLIHTYDHITLDPLVLQRLRAYTDYQMQDMGRQEVDRQEAEFRAYFDNFRIATLNSALSNGAIYFDANGNLLPTSSGATETVSFQLNANNTGHLNGIVTASWALANTDITAQLRNLKIRAAYLTGYPLKYAFYGANIPTYFAQNNYVADYLSRSPTWGTKWLETAEIPDGLFGYVWVPVYQAFYQDAGGTNQPTFGSDTVVFTPEITADWYEWLEGSFEVPTSLGTFTSAQAAMTGGLRREFGMFSYGRVIDDPPTIRLMGGDTFLPTIKNPDVVFVATVNP